MSFTGEMILIKLNYRELMPKWEEKMVRLGHIDVVRQEALIHDKESTKGRKQEFGCPLQISSIEEESSESQTFVHIIKNNNSTDNLIARSVTALKLSKDKNFRILATSQVENEGKKEVDDVKKELSGVKDTGESSRMDSIRIDQPNNITAEVTSTKNEKSKGILKSFKNLFKFQL